MNLWIHNAAELALAGCLMLFYIWPVPLVAAYTYRRRRSLERKPLFCIVGVFMCYGVLAIVTAACLMAPLDISSPDFSELRLIVLMVSEVALAVAMLSKLRSAWGPRT